MSGTCIGETEGRWCSPECIDIVVTLARGLRDIALRRGKTTDELENYFPLSTASRETVDIPRVERCLKAFRDLSQLVFIVTRQYLSTFAYLSGDSHYLF